MRWLPWVKPEPEEPNEGERLRDEELEETRQQMRDLLERAVNLGIEADNVLRRY